MLPLSSRRSSTGLMSNFSYFASRTPRATFSKSQNTAMLTLSWDEAIGVSGGVSGAVAGTAEGAHDSHSRRRHGASHRVSGHPVGGSAAGEEGLHVVEHAHAHADPRLARGAAQMRQQDDVLQAQQARAD